MRARAVLSLCALSALAAPQNASGGDRVLAATRADNAITLIDGESMEAISTHDLTIGAHELAVSPDGSLAIGSAYGSGPQHQTPDNRLAVFDLAGGGLLHTIDLGAHERPNDVRFSTDNRHALVTSEVKASVLLVDARAGTVVKEIALERKAGHMLCATPDLSRAYVSHVSPGLVTMVDVEKGEAVKTVPTALGAEGIDVTPDGSRVWVANNRSHSIMVLDGLTLEPVVTMMCDGFPFRVRCSPDGSTVAVSCPMIQQVALYDAKTAKLRARAFLKDDFPGKDATPTSIAFSSDSGTLYAACPAMSLVVAIDATDGSIKGAAETGEGLDGLAVVPG